MPRLLFFVPCTKSVVDDTDKTLVIFQVFGGLNAAATNPILPVPEQSAAPFAWSTVSMWLRIPDDEGKIFEEKLSVVFPDGRAAGEVVQRFQMTEKRWRIRTVSDHFPITVSGEYFLRLLLREVVEGEQEPQWEVVSDYPIDVNLSY